MFESWLRTHSTAEFSLKHRLFEKASNRTFWERHLGQAQIQAAQSHLDYAWPMIRARHFMAFQRTGDRMLQEDPHFARRKALLTLFLGELAEHKGRFLPDLCDGIFAICEETFWGLSAHYPITREGDLLPSAADPYIDLFAAETAELLSVIYHILYDELLAFCPQIPERLEYELERRILTPYCNRGDFWWMGNTPMKPNNWTPWILQNVLTVFVTVPVSPARLSFALSKMLTEMQRYYDILPDDGGCDEGSSYWTKAGAKLFAFCDVLYIASDGEINLFRDKKLRNIFLFEARAYIGSCRFVNFSDGTSLLADSIIDYPLYGAGLRTGEECLCCFAATLKKDQSVFRSVPAERIQSSIKEQLFALIYAKDIDAQLPYIPQDECVLPDLQTAYLRQNGWYTAIKGGHNAEAHNHNDVASFIVYYENEPILVDPGIGTYTRQTFSPRRYELPGTQSAYHNLPLINGQQQQNGREFRADRFEAKDKTVTVSFAQAYPACAGVAEAVRTLRLHAEGVDILDTFTFTNRGQAIEHFMTPLPVALQGDTALIGGKFALTVKDAQARVDQMDFEGDKKYIRSWGCQALNRIRFTLHAEEAQITLRRLP